MLLPINKAVVGEPVCSCVPIMIYQLSVYSAQNEISLDSIHFSL